MTYIIKDLTFKMMYVIIEALEPARPGRTHTQNFCEPP